MQAGAAMQVELRGAGNDVLHQVVREGFGALRAALDERRLPRFVEREFEGYLACGDLEHGFAWLTCAGCATHRLVPFSCKKRGFCPACCGRRMVVTAAKWVDEVLPRVAVRQWTPKASEGPRPEHCEGTRRQGG